MTMTMMTMMTIATSNDNIFLSDVYQAYDGVGKILSDKKSTNGKGSLQVIRFPRVKEEMLFLLCVFCVPMGV